MSDLRHLPPLMAVVLFIQALCAGVFLWDLIATIFGLHVTPVSWQTRELMEIGAALGLLLGLIFGALTLVRSARKHASMQSQLRVASGAFMDVLDEHFKTWALTPAERDVALFTLKGMTVADIAELRNTSEGTIKAQNNAIYRKAGVSGRAQLLSVFIDELMSEALVEA